MGIMIIPGGCRRVDAAGRSVRQSCATCERPGFCELEPRARELAELISNQWVSTREETPPAMEDLLYLERTAMAPSGVVHHGYYDDNQQAYIAWVTDRALSADAVIAWMLVPAVPETVYPAPKQKKLRKRGKMNAQLNFPVEG
ncbi:MAG: hypothetical protein R3F37_14515 [Candidatus Competibacteraceae bacterium]